MSPRLSSFLDAARWIAAAIVVFDHLRGFVFADDAQIRHAGALVKAAFVLTNIGHQAVMVFFVISGFLVGGLSVHKAQAGRFSLADYAASRFSRIYAVLVPALILGGALDLIGSRFADGAGLYTTIGPFHIPSLQFTAPVADQLGWTTFAANLLMLERITSTHLGSNGPLWSLAYEWWYYCLFAAALTGWVGKGRVVRILAIGVAVAILAGLPLRISLWAVVWALGVAGGAYLRAGLPRPSPRLGAVAFLVGLAASKGLHHFEVPGASILIPFAGDLAAGLGFAVMMVGWASGSKPLPLARFHRWAADFSYSVYLAHFPFLLLVMALLHDRLGVPLAAQPNLGGLALMGGLFVLIIAYCYAFSRVFEAYTPQLKALLRRSPRPLAVTAD